MVQSTQCREGQVSTGRLDSTRRLVPGVRGEIPCVPGAVTEIGSAVTFVADPVPIVGRSVSKVAGGVTFVADQVTPGSGLVPRLSDCVTPTGCLAVVHPSHDGFLVGHHSAHLRSHQVHL
jgi:hypothetical protein